MSCMTLTSKCVLLCWELQWLTYCEGFEAYANCVKYSQVVSKLIRSTEDSHVKTNLVHTLYRVQKYGLLPIERFQEMLRPSELRMCGAQKARKTWYSMPLQVFTSFVFRVRVYEYASLSLTIIFLRSSPNITNLQLPSVLPVQQEIAQSTDAAGRRYNEVTPEDDRIPEQRMHAMRSGAHERTSKLNVKMSKLVAVANPANNQGFLDEVISQATRNSKSNDVLRECRNIITFAIVLLTRLRNIGVAMKFQR